MAGLDRRIWVFGAAASLTACYQRGLDPEARDRTVRAAATGGEVPIFNGTAVASVAAIELPDEGWRKALSAAEFDVLRRGGTEMAFTHPLDHEKRQGIFTCAGCGTLLFRSEEKFDSGSGWPSFTRPVSAKNVTLAPDGAFGITRTEVRCRRCQGHLGHVFEDGPLPLGTRYCINGTALRFHSGSAAKLDGE